MEIDPSFLHFFVIEVYFNLDHYEISVAPSIIRKYSFYSELRD